MEHHGLAIGTELDVAFDAEAPGDRRLRSRDAVLDHARGRVVQASMRDRPGDQPAEAGMAVLVDGPVSHQAISNIASTSTAAPAGSSATPTVERA